MAFYLEVSMDWISVNEQMPTVGDYGYVRVLVFCQSNKYVGEMEYTFPQYAKTEKGKAPRWQWGGRISPWAVTHWMPLPPAPVTE